MGEGGREGLSVRASRGARGIMTQSLRSCPHQAINKEVESTGSVPLAHFILFSSRNMLPKSSTRHKDDLRLEVFYSV